MKRSSRVALCLEVLEARLTPNSQFWIDGDGDKVQFTSSKGDLTGHIAQSFPNAQGVFSVDISGPSFAGTDLTVFVTKSKAGDGQAIVGHIKAGVNNLGTVRIHGDLGDINAGSGSAKVPAIKKLKVDSFGRFGQRGNGNFDSNISGNVDRLIVRDDFIDTFFHVTGNIGSASIGGSIIGGDAPDSGEILADGELGSVSVSHDIRGGDGTYSGSVGSTTNVASVNVGGSIYGGIGSYSGLIFAAYAQNGRINSVNVGGSLIGGYGTSSGTIGDSPGAVGAFNVTSLGKVEIGGDIVGGYGEGSGTVSSLGGTLDVLKVKGSLVGGPSNYSGCVHADGHIGSIKFGGSLLGGAGFYTGNIFTTGGIDAVTIGGSLIGGTGQSSALVNVSAGFLGKLKIHGDVRGGGGLYSGSVISPGGITSKFVGGTVIPNGVFESGVVIS
jgi:hypothetical protein